MHDNEILLSYAENNESDACALTTQIYLSYYKEQWFLLSLNGSKCIAPYSLYSNRFNERNNFNAEHFDSFSLRAENCFEFTIFFLQPNQISFLNN